MRKLILDNIRNSCLTFQNFERWYVDGTIHNPARDKIFLEAASQKDYFKQAKKLIIGYHNWNYDTNERIIEFSKYFS